MTQSRPGLCLRMNSHTLIDGGFGAETPFDVGATRHDPGRPIVTQTMRNPPERRGPSWLGGWSRLPRWVIVLAVAALVGVAVAFACALVGHEILVAICGDDLAPIDGTAAADDPCGLRTPTLPVPCRRSPWSRSDGDGSSGALDQRRLRRLGPQACEQVRSMARTGQFLGGVRSPALSPAGRGDRAQNGSSRSSAGSERSANESLAGMRTVARGRAHAPGRRVVSWPSPVVGGPATLRTGGDAGGCVLEPRPRRHAEHRMQVRHVAAAPEDRRLAAREDAIRRPRVVLLGRPLGRDEFRMERRE